MAEITNRVNMVPAIDDSLDLGKTEQRFKDVYVSGHLTDGTDSVAVGDIPAMANGSLTETHIPFADANGALSESANLAWNDTDAQINVGGPSDIFYGPQYSLTMQADNADYTSFGIQNLNADSTSSTDVVVSADNDGAGLVGHYVDLGISSSTYDATTVGYILTVSIYTGGSGYTVGDELTILSGGENALLTVDSVGPDGDVLTVTVTRNGTGYEVAEGLPVSGGTGAACYVNVDTLLPGLYGPNDGYLYTSGGSMYIGSEDDATSSIRLYVADVANGYQYVETAVFDSTGPQFPTLTTNGYLKTTGGDGSLTVDTTPVASESLAIAYAVAL